MRKWAALLIVLGVTLPAVAAKSVSVDQLDQLLTTNQGKADAHVAAQLSDFELTERVSPERLAKWEKNFPGEKTRDALMRLADSAAFLNTPATEMMRIAPPDPDTQDKMMALASEYVKTTMTRLPNFSATRETTHFEDAPTQEQMTATTPAPSGWRMRPLGISIGRSEAKPLHSTGIYSGNVTYRDGYEVHDDTGPKDVNAGAAANGLTTGGEFGPILSVVIGDAMRSHVSWSHWEQSTGDPMAVVHYAVPADQSNYEVGIPNGKKIDSIYPGYHGEIALDPATGSILRLSLVADLPGLYESMQTAILVEYAPVTIGDRTYICPVHGVAYSKVPVAGATADPQSGSVTVQTQMNDVVVTNYHLFASESRILASESGTSRGGADGREPKTDGANATQSADPPKDRMSPAAQPAEPQP